MALSHLGVNVPDLAAAKAYFDALMPLVGFEAYVTRDDQFSYRPAGGEPGTAIFFYPALAAGAYTRHAPGLQHLAFDVASRAVVHEVHAWATARGAEIVYAPQEFPQYRAGYYATFWLSPEGFMLEAVCRRVAGAS